MISESQLQRRKRLLYQSTHRGTKEADLIIGGFAEKHLANLSEELLNSFEQLLSVSDPDLMLWINGQDTPPRAYQTELWSLIMKYKNNR